LRFRNIRSLLTWIVLAPHQNMTAKTLPNCPTFCSAGTTRALFKRTWVVWLSARLAEIRHQRNRADDKKKAAVFSN